MTPAASVSCRLRRRTRSTLGAMMNPNHPTAPSPGPSARLDRPAARLRRRRQHGQRHPGRTDRRRPPARAASWWSSRMRRKRDIVRDKFGVRVEAAGGAALAGADIVVWAVKPQVFGEAAAPCAPFVGGALHLSVMAGIRSDAIARATGSERVVRAMPNTPALIGEGIAGPVRARRGDAGRPRRDRARAGAHRRDAVGGAGERPRRRDRAVGLRARPTCSSSSRP